MKNMKQKYGPFRNIGKRKGGLFEYHKKYYHAENRKTK